MLQVYKIRWAGLDKSLYVCMGVGIRNGALKSSRRVLRIWITIENVTLPFTSIVCTWKLKVVWKIFLWAFVYYSARSNSATIHLDLLILRLKSWSCV